MPLGTTHVKRAVIGTLVFALVLGNSLASGSITPVFHASARTTSTLPLAAFRLPASAQIVAKGQVSLYGVQIQSNATIFKGGNIRTGKDSSAIVSFGRFAQVELKNGSDFTLAHTETSLKGELRAGRASFYLPAGIPLAILTPDGLVQRDGILETRLSIEVANGKIAVVDARAPVLSSANLSIGEMKGKAESLLTAASAARARMKQAQFEAYNNSDKLKSGCISDKLNTLDSLFLSMSNRNKDLEESIAKNDTGIASSQLQGIYALASRIAELDNEVAICTGEKTEIPNDPGPVKSPTPQGGGVGGGAGGRGGLVTGSLIIGGLVAAAIWQSVNNPGATCGKPLSPIVPC